jgi:hypothetical protein
LYPASAYCETQEDALLDAMIAGRSVRQREAGYTESYSLRGRGVTASALLAERAVNILAYAAEHPGFRTCDCAAAYGVGRGGSQQRALRELLAAGCLVREGRTYRLPEAADGHD